MEKKEVEIIIDELITVVFEDKYGSPTPGGTNYDPDINIARLKNKILDLLPAPVPPRNEGEAYYRERKGKDVPQKEGLYHVFLYRDASEIRVEDTCYFDGIHWLTENNDTIGAYLIPAPSASAEVEALRRELERLREQNEAMKQALIEVFKIAASMPGGAQAMKRFANQIPTTPKNKQDNG